MAKKSDEPLQKHTINLYHGDYERLQALAPDIGANILIRRLVRDYLTKMSPPARVARSNVEL